MKSALALSILPAPLPLSYNQQGIGDVDVADPSKPLEVLIGPITLKQRDRLELFWGANDDVIDTYTHSSDSPDTNGTFSLYVDTRWIKSGVTDVRYAYLPFPSNTPEHSPIQKVIVKLDLPGGRDPDPATPYENEKLQLPAINPAGIITTPENVSITIQPYENMTVGDVIAVYWHGIEVECPPLISTQLGKPVVIDIDKEIVIEAGDSENIVVRYEIRDIVNNWSRFSLPSYTEVEIGNSSLPAPIAPQAPNMELDLDKLAGGDVQALVLSNANIVIGDTIEFIVERSTAEGIALEPYTASKVVQVPGSFVEFLIANDQFQPIAQGRARLKYKVTKASGDVLRSKSLPLTILGEAQQLEPPRVPAAVNGLLDPKLRNVIAEVPPYHFMADGNDVTLVLMGRTPGGETVMHDEVKNLNQDDIDKTLEFLIPDDKISALAGGSLEVYYTVKTYAKAFFKSPVLQLLVDIDNTTPLPAPVVDKVGADGFLDPADIVLEALMRVMPYQGMAEGDKVTAHWDSSAVGGTYSTYTVINSGMINREAIFRVPKRYVDASIGRTVEAWYEVQRGNRVALSDKLLINIREMIIPATPTPTVKQATGDTLDPANAPNGATVVIDASASFKAGDRVTVQWMGPKGSDTKEKTLIDSEAGQPLETVFASALVVANAGQVVDVFYTVNRANGLVQTSATLALKVLAGLTKLPAPRMDTVGHDGVVRPSLIPDSGATVRVSYPGMSGEDSVVLNWRGLSSHDTSAKPATGNELQFNVPKAWIIASQGGSASVTYTVSRDSVSKGSVPLWLTVEKELVFDTSPVTLAGKVYLIPSVPDLLPSLPAGTSVRRQASGGQAPYRYTSSNPLVAKVDGNGLTTVRGNGTATISVTDASGTSKSYQVTVTKVIHCLGLGSGSLSQMSSAASAKGGRIPSINELKEIYTTYGNRWPLGNGKYWSSTVAAVNLVGWKWYFVKNLVTGADFKLLHHNASLGVAIR
ncbi:Ig-like domain-containing protein [Pseudomonas alliivorans]|nr:Ig-like domain-containing protein [Pseudomonas alliivorans]MEE5153146.1 Ig-like domain-containing protein [Pseudomonas alliivorans]